ncbi:MAG: hypothetical protein I3273_00095 [Candidatus Moeniiplasma glomeromycotorum]|nr:hypothetical protein [Candidatus Moeniiplasma glomeromycotorum]MCE8167470.1 hypothetical protein [Candidatus Moeniiplasma glomeromycotorum]MCE8168516.1 hypothetical protein [Candidatus Moeniiplasma glomeromycotorum]
MPTTYKEILNLKCNLTPSQLSVLDIPNKNTVPIKDLLDRKLRFSDKGSEIGSINYISHSSRYFIRTKALQADCFLPFLNNETAITIRPQVFKGFNLREWDLIISKDANIGEAVILDQDYPNFMMSGALYRLPITKNKLYLLAFLKHRHFRKQLDILVPKGSTIRHAKTLFLDCKIPFPNQNDATEIIKYVELLTGSIINKEKEIRRKDQLIFELIEKELLENQRENKFKYEGLKFNELSLNSRIDSGYYCYNYKQKQFLISNYKNGVGSIDKWNFKIKKGQDLAVNKIGKKTIYSDSPKKNFYTLIKPTNFSEFGTIKKFEYLGNSKKLAFLQSGDIVFSTEGTIGKCVLFDNPKGDKWITNIHGLVLKKKDHNVKESAFVSCFLRFLKNWGIFDYISVGGQGGSLTKKYWKDIMIANFLGQKRHEILSLYYNPTIYPNGLNLNNFLEKDQQWNQQAGILEIDKSIKLIKEHLNKVLDKIVNDEEVEINFNF